MTVESPRVRKISLLEKELDWALATAPYAPKYPRTRLEPSAYPPRAYAKLDTPVV
jgi:hypothetical protein